MKKFNKKWVFNFSLSNQYIKKIIITVLLLIMIVFSGCKRENTGGPDWEMIKSNATFVVPDASYGTPYIQPLNVGGWEDGLYISRDGLELFAIYIPVDLFSLLDAWQENPICFDYRPYYRPPMLDVDMVSNPWGCETFFQGDIIIATRKDTCLSFSEWHSSNLRRSVSNEGGACGVLKDKNTFDVFVFTQNRNDTEDMEIMFMRNVSRNPSLDTAVPILSSPANEDNPHIERLDDDTLLLFFDRDRYIYYTRSYDNGTTWEEPVKITHVLNDQSPYDVQPHLWNDGTHWWVYFCADNEHGKRCIYRSKQEVPGDWDNWGPRELVIEPGEIIGRYGIILGVGEPTLTDRGDISFVVIYGDLNSNDPADVWDCDPWFLPKK